MNFLSGGPINIEKIPFDMNIIKKNINKILMI